MVLFSARRLARSKDYRCSIIDRELHRIPPEPAVAAQMSCNMDRDTARLGKELTERCPDSSECDRPQPARVERIGQCAAQMAIPDDFGVGDSHTRKHEAWFRIARAEGGQPLDVPDQVGLSCP